MMSYANIRFQPKTGPIGLDFDNTIVAYDQVFCRAAQSRGLLPQDFIGTKRAVRDAIRHLPDGERAWQHLQGHVYGGLMAEATLFEGVDRFLRRCRREGVGLHIVSHKTEYSPVDPLRINLRSTAFGWLEHHGFFADDGFGLARENVHFEATRVEKLTRIAALGCRFFIDDLAEVLNDPGFPPNVGRILFAASPPDSTPPYPALANWRQIELRVFGDDA
ncbi:MAG: hypothetical protein QOJ54_2403 [Aliidongia sp.]|nr:hypothetical protein [Aliidongia sp.]